MRHFINQLQIAIKSTVRNFQKNWVYGLLNILGLSIAFMTLILVAFYLYQETSYESFHKNADRIYRPTHHITTQNDFEVHFARIPVDFINELPNEIPEIEKLIRFQNQEQKYVRIREKRFKPKHAYVTDHDVFEVFNFPLRSGDKSSALVQPNSIVITESLAERYFGKTDILNEEVVITGDWSEDEEKYVVTGVMEDLPVNTHLPIEMLISFSSQQDRRGWAYVYTLLAQGVDIKSVEEKIPAFIDKFSNSDNAPTISFDFQALADIHLKSQLAREIQPNGQLLYVKIFFWVGFFVWIIALINFSNLSTALAMSRGKEVGVRRVLGATTNNLFFFSLTESIVYSLSACILGAFLAFVLFPSFSQLTGTVIIPPFQYLIPFFISLSIFSGLLAGMFPSFILTSIKILQTIKQGNNWSMRGRDKSALVKRGMIAIQFCVTIILIGGSIGARQQINYINNKNLGLKADQVMTIPQVPDHVSRQYAVFKNRLHEVPGISAVSACMQSPSTEIRDVGPVRIKGINEDVSQAPMMDIQVVDPDFISMMGIELLAGEDFTSSMTLTQVPEFTEQLTVQQYLLNAPRKYLINETAMKQLGFQNPQNAIGKEVNWEIGSFELAYGPITGILKDYNQESLKNEVDPIVVVVEPLWLQNFFIKIATSNIEQTISQVEKIWNDMFPYAMEYAFLDEMFDQLYKQDRVQLKLLSMLAIIAIIISFMGLVSLVAYALKRRAKELAIRRVIGANLASLTGLIGMEYIKIVAIAAILAIPLSYLWISNWLQNFAYHIRVSPMIYVVAIVFIYALLLITIFLQTWKATYDQPVEALREE